MVVIDNKKIQSKCIKSVWRTRHNGGTTTWTLISMTTRTAIFTWNLPGHGDGKLKFTHKLQEHDNGNFQRLFIPTKRLDNAFIKTCNLIYKYSKNRALPLKDTLKLKCEALPAHFKQHVENDECPICLDSKCDILTTCGHKYCGECFKQLHECAFCKLSK